MSTKLQTDFFSTFVSKVFCAVATTLLGRAQTRTQHKDFERGSWVK